MEICEYKPIKIVAEKRVNVIDKIVIFVIAFVMAVTMLNTLSIQQVSSVNAEQLKINNLLTKDSMNIDNNKTMQRALMVANNLPDSIKHQLYDENYTIKLQKDLIHLTGNKVEWAQGLNNYSKKSITIVDWQLSKNSKAKDEILTENDSFTLLHEIGHAVEKKPISIEEKTYTVLSEDIDFMKGYDEEKYQLFNTNTFKDLNDDYLRYFRLYPSEYFAECFALYYNSQESRNILKTNAPLTYQFIKENVDK